MPHIILEGYIDLRKFYNQYQPSTQHAEGEVLKLQNIFLNQSGNTALIEAIAVEQGPPNRFFVQVLTKDSRTTTVRIYPGSAPEKTLGVKKILALVAKHLKDQDPATQYRNTNLKEFLL